MKKWESFRILRFTENCFGQTISGSNHRSGTFAFLYYLLHPLLFYGLGNCGMLILGSGCLYFLELISFKDYEKMTDNLFNIYEFTRETAENNK